ncbi:hypothetical protein SAY87_020334 [Trapa incisa]|uniref:Secreted protein n=1 Tax=Trapa incisa TaxID=236973 RepID=A0AAN7Q478_9MYRT|nr:hypothetical protein SAY87_020334 [Trapa incisa]
MGRLQSVFVAERAAIVLLLLLTIVQPNEAARMLADKNGGRHDLLLHVLQAGAVPSPGNGCTSIPGGSGRPCVGSRKFAGRYVAPPETHLHQVTEIGLPHQH